MKPVVWTLAEQDEGRLTSIGFELLAWGRRLADKSGGELVSVLLGADVDDAALRDLIRHGADRVLFVKDASLAHPIMEPAANALEHVARERKPDVFIAGATTFGRTLMPVLAIRLTTGLTADCTGLDIEAGTNNLIQTRPAIGGNILATILTAKHRPQMATVRPRSARPLEADDARTGEVETVTVPADLLRTPVEWLDLERHTQDEADLQSADRIVSAGSGLKKAENLALVRRLAEQLGAAIGATRNVVDRGWLPYAHQVGLSGKTVSPSLYVAVGVSGAIQHLAGMKTSETIVAINSDPHAQIFQVSDFGIVGDLFEVMPAVIDAIARRKGGAS